MTRNYRLLFITACLVSFSINGLFAQKKDKDSVGQDLKGYSEIVNKNAVSVYGMVNLHKVKSKLYLELPMDKIGKEMLLAGRISSISNNRDMIAGRMPTNPLMISFSKDDEKVFINISDKRYICDTSESIYNGYKKNYTDPVLGAFPIIAYNKDSSTVLIEISDFVCQDKAPFTPLQASSGFGAMFGINPIKGKLIKEYSGVIGIKAFEKNINITTRMVYDVTGTPFTAEMTISLLLLPENIMRPRYANPAIGLFTDSKSKYSADTDYIKDIDYVNRWNLSVKAEDIEKYKKGELVEPEKPIVFYVDSAFPEKWRPWLKEGIEDWQMAFEKIGFKNAIIAKDFPDDPNFDPNDIKNTCLYYSTSTTANAMGPSWTDPRSGEILQASVYFYHNVLSILHNWRFIQTAAADSSARATNYDMTIMGPLLRYLVVHEVGHTLGLMHNMRGSYAYPTDSLRSKSFTDKYGTTASIMDYARFNYVAQPGDGVTNFLPKRLGLYDYYAIEWAYKPIFEAKTPEEEVPVLASWIKAKENNPIYQYGEQEIFGSSDPASQSESLGDDCIKASQYGINNLKTITSNLIDWVGVKGSDYKDVTTMWEEVFKQFKRYMNHCKVYISGTYKKESFIGDTSRSYVIVPKAKQKEALAFIYKSICELPSWYNSPKLLSIKPRNEIITQYQSSVIHTLISNATIMRMASISKLAEENDRYTAEEYVDDLFDLVWSSSLADKQLTWAEQRMQYTYVQTLLEGLNLLGKSNMKGQDSNDLNNDEPVLTYEPYDYQAPDMTPYNSKDNDLKMYFPTIQYNHLLKVRDLIKKKVNASKGDTSAHYKYLLYEIEKALTIG
jgi:hypothetical protein